MERKSAIYARQSVDKKDSLSIETQIEIGKEKAGERFETYTDKGYSGKNTNRPELTRLKRDIEDGKISKVIVYRLDRISRNISDFYSLYQLMERNKVEFISISEAFDTSSPAGRALMGILIVFAQMERESIQERVKDNYYYRISTDGRWPGGKAPWGFNIGKDEHGKATLIPNSDMEMVRTAFDMYANDQNTSLGKIARKLYELGYRSEHSTNGAFPTTSLSKMLQNPIYAIADQLLYKYYQSQGIEILNDKESWNGSRSAHLVAKSKEPKAYITNFAGTIDSKTFIVVQERISLNEQFARGNSATKMEELAGLVKCAKCGYAVRPNKLPYLSCFGKATLHVCDVSFKKLRFPQLQEKVAAEVQTKLDQIACDALVKGAEVNKIEKEIEKLKQARENLFDLVEQGVTISRIKSRLDKIDNQINELEIKQIREVTFAQKVKITQSPPYVFARYTMEQKKNILKQLVDKILLDEDGTIEVIWKE